MPTMNVEPVQTVGGGTPATAEPKPATPKKAPPKTEKKEPGKKVTTPPKKAAGKGASVDPAPTKGGRSEPDPERAAAKEVGLNLCQYKVLKWLAKRPEGSEPATYKDIEAGTGYYQSLTADMRAGKEGSLSDKGFVKELVKNVDGKDKVSFTITAKGKKIFAK